MTQYRYYNYGSTIINTTERDVHFALHEKGIYRGFSMGVDANYRLTVSSGYGMQHNGVVWKEDATMTMIVPSPAVATSYTLVATHEDRSILGGVAVEYSLEEGILTNADVFDGVVLGWINHPGGGSHLLQTYITESIRYVDDDYAALVARTQPLELIPPFTRYANSIIGTNITFTETEFDTVFYLTNQRVSNAPAAVPNVQQLVQNIVVFAQNGLRPVMIKPYVNFASTLTTNLTVEVFDTNQALVTVTGGVITGSGVWTDHTVTVEQTSGTFDEGKPYTVRLTHNVNKGEYIKIGRLLISFWPYP